MLYHTEPALYECDFESSGFEGIDCNDSDNRVISYKRKSRKKKDKVLIICNFTPVVRSNYRFGVPAPGFWKEIYNSDATHYYGSGHGNMGGVEAFPLQFHGRTHSINMVAAAGGAIY